jgi:hypothetical protein
MPRGFGAAGWQLRDLLIAGGTDFLVSAGWYSEQSVGDSHNLLLSERALRTDIRTNWVFFE